MTSFGDTPGAPATPSPAPLEGNDPGVNARRAPRDKTALSRDLPPWQILMIAIGGVIGVTIFSTDGEILNTAGPAGLLAAWLFVALTTIFVMECIGELVIMWPVSNAMIEYVKAFLDEDLAIVVGIAYWYTMSSVFAALIIAAAYFSSYWITEPIWQTILFFVFIPIMLLFINCMGVKYYGWIEGVGGILKLTLVACGLFFMIVDATRVGSSNIQENFRHQPAEADNSFIAICISIPVLGYGFIGTEIVSVTAFEAQKRESLRFPVRWVAYIICFTYFICILLETVVVNWLSPGLRSLDHRSLKSPLVSRASEPGSTFPIVVLAARQYGSIDTGWFFNACIIYFCISAANTALYVASRTLFGLTRGINRMHNPAWYLRPLKYFGITSPFAKVPHWALIASAFSFFWLPFLQLKIGYSINDLLIIMSTTGSIGCILVWASQCATYIRYHHWLHSLKKSGQLPPAYNRWDPQPDKYPWHRSRMHMASIQPIPAWGGLVSCVMIVFVFSTATWWNGVITFRKVASAYAGPVILSGIFVVLKIWNQRGWVKLGQHRDLFEVTDSFEMNSGLPLTRALNSELLSNTQRNEDRSPLSCRYLVERSRKVRRALGLLRQPQ